MLAFTEYKSQHAMLQLSKTLFGPHLEYCVQFWSPHYRKDAEALMRVQKRFTSLHFIRIVLSNFEASLQSWTESPISRLPFLEGGFMEHGNSPNCAPDSWTKIRALISAFQPAIRKLEF